MPSTGMPSSSSSVRSLGAPSAYTDAGPPDRISPRGARALISSSETWWGSSSENTPHSRTRRAMSCEYWPPKSRTSTSCEVAARASPPAGRGGTAASDIYSPTSAVSGVSVASPTGPPPVSAGTPFALGAVEGGDVLVAARRHRRPQAAHQVERAVVLVRRHEQDLLQRAVLRRLDAG